MQRSNGCIASSRGELIKNGIGLHAVSDQSRITRAWICRRPVSLTIATCRDRSDISTLTVSAGLRSSSASRWTDNQENSALTNPGRTILGSVCFLIGAAVVAANLWIMGQEIRGKRAPSPVPLFGGLLAAFGIAILPIGHARALALAPIVLDWGGVLGLAASIVRRR